MTSGRQLYLDRSYIFGCIRNGAKNTKRGKSSLVSTVASTLDVIDDRILVDRWLPKNGHEKLVQAHGEPVYIDVRPVANPATRGRNIRYRVAASVGWKAKFTMCWENSLLSFEEMSAILRDAGRFAGLGDARNIGYGRFDILSFNIVEESRAKKPLTKRAVAGSSS
jgi:hypothetical protein